MEKGTITIEIENYSLEATERLRRIFTALIVSRALEIKNGKTTLHFDDNYALREIETHQKKWKGNTDKWDTKPTNQRPRISTLKPSSEMTAPSTATSGSEKASSSADR